MLYDSNSFSESLPSLEPGPEDRQDFIEAVWRRSGDKIMHAVSGMPCYEGADLQDNLMDMLWKLCQRLPDFLVPERAGDYAVEPGAPGYIARPDTDVTDATRWVNRCVYNARMDAYRAYDRHHRTLRLRGHLLPDGMVDDGTRMSEDPAVTVIRNLDHLDNIRRLARLPQPLSDVALLRYQGYTVRETAHALGISEAAVKQRLQSIRNPKNRALLGI